MDKPKSRVFLYIYWFTFPIFLLFLLELSLTTYWDNPYRLENTIDQYTRFHQKGIVAYARIENRLYKGNHDVRFSINDKMAVSDGFDKETKKAVALGGSTTEAALVPEGRRWPDLLKVPTLNYGVSGNTSIDGFYNLRFLLESNLVDPKYVFLMYGINDLRAFLLKGKDGFKVEGWSEPSANLLASIDGADQEVSFGIRIRDSALLSFIRYHANNFFGRTFFESYYEQRKAQERLESLTDAEFNKFLDKLKLQFLPMRKNVYVEIFRLAKDYKISLILLTQPHAYGEECQPLGDDLRLFPVVGKKRMTLMQSSVVMGLINDQTRELARIFGEQIIDGAACFSELSCDDLFYDSVHYSVEGSKQLAKCVNRFL